MPREQRRGMSTVTLRTLRRFRFESSGPISPLLTCMSL
ncbi:hypothetical protein CPT_Milagro_051 [Burkholderia phage Milagro]|uniref:Uncharacterized protein n=1 Tax=Burkholderia phage Milagro TaxID=2924901 RepID=A0AAE9G890_9CAUD|nr:hypothetical protein CPT_Milagro_051 [Burkholderia phage Milagro]